MNNSRKDDPTPDRASSSFLSLKNLWASPWWPAALALITFLVYVPSLGSHFVTDARREVLEEGFVTSLANLPKVLTLQVLRMHLMLSDRPGEMLYLMANAAVWGKAPFGYHLDSILVHAASVALLLVLLRRLVANEGATPSAQTQVALIAVALVFALHPIATESVAEVSFSSALLVTFFALAGLLCATAFRPGHPRSCWIAGSLGVFCAFAAVLAKESGIAVALLLIVYWFLFRRRDPLRPWFFFLLSAVLVTAVLAGVILHFSTSEQFHLDYLGGSLGQVFLIQPQLWVFMLGQLAWPTRLVADYTLADMHLFPTWLALVVLVIFLAFQAWLARRSRLGALGVAVWWLGLSTVSNFIPLYCIVADRFYYLPLAGAAIQLAAILLLLLHHRAAFLTALAAVFLALAFFTTLTVARQAVFDNEDALWADTLQKSPHSYLARYSRGVAFIKQGRLQDAAAELRLAVANEGRNSSACVGLGLIAQCLGRPAEAADHFRQALALNPDNSEAHCNLGIALCQMGEFNQGIDQFNQAIALDPGDATSHTNLGMALLQLGRDDDAIRQFRAALEADPKSIPAHYQLGNILSRQGQPDQAAGQFQDILQLDSNHVEALANLGVIAMHQGRLDQAIDLFRRALKLRPEAAEIHNDLGVALAQKGNLPNAITEFQQALRLNPKFASAQANLNRAQAASKTPP